MMFSFQEIRETSPFQLYLALFQDLENNSFSSSFCSFSISQRNESLSSSSICFWQIREKDAFSDIWHWWQEKNGAKCFHFRMVIERNRARNFSFWLKIRKKRARSFFLNEDLKEEIKSFLIFEWRLDIIEQKLLHL